MKRVLLVLAVLALAQLACSVDLGTTPAAPAAVAPQPVYATPYVAPALPAPAVPAPQRESCNQGELVSWIAIATPAMEEAANITGGITPYTDANDLSGLMSYTQAKAPRLHQLADQIKNSNPPPCAEKANDLVASSIEEVALAFDDVGAGNLDAGLVHLTKANELINQAVTELEKLTGSSTSATNTL
jgi:hypothetical protein